jgi:type I restriction enzyme M protein
MPNGSSAVVQKLWNYCNILRDDGLSYGDYVEQLTYLLFLKMADEWKQLDAKRAPKIPKEYDWQSLVAPEMEGAALERHYRKTLENLGKEAGMLGVIFRKAQNKVQDPAKLRRLIADLIDREQWTSLDVDVKGDAYEGLLEKNAEDVKTGAGQYFTPRALIRAMVDVMRPEPGKSIHDPACGTGGLQFHAITHSLAQRRPAKPFRVKRLRTLSIATGVAPPPCCAKTKRPGLSLVIAQLRGVDKDET